MSRLPAKLWVDAVRRAAAAEGGFAAILAKGEETGGAVILVLRSREGLNSAYARTNLGDGQVDWRALVENEPDPAPKLTETLEKQRRFDPDLWLVELDIADPAQFVADLPDLG